MGLLMRTLQFTDVAHIEYQQDVRRESIVIPRFT